MNARQRRSHNEEGEFYGSELESGTGTDGFGKDASVPILLYSNVKCMINQGPGVSSPTVLGRTDADLTLTLDKITVAADDVVANYPLLAQGDAKYFKLVQPGHPQNGQWWAIMGDPTVTPSRGRRKANAVLFRARQTKDPTV